MNKKTAKEKLALNGGTPVRSSYLPYGHQSFGKEEIQKIVQVLHSDWITTGPVVKEFEEKFAKEVGAKYAVAVNSGTAALHIACLSLGLKPGDEVITTPLTFVASSNAVLYCGGTPVFADIEPDTYNLNPVQIKKKITKRTKGIIPVHFAGHPCEMGAIRDLAKKQGLWVLEDAAHALSAKYRGKKIGSLSEATIFSFHPVKNITTGEGGMVTTNSASLYQQLLLYRTHGIERSTVNDWIYDMKFLGYRFNMTEMQAALGVCQLKKLPSFQQSRRKIVSFYQEHFSQMLEWKIPQERKEVVSSWHLYPIQWNLSKRVSRDQVMRALRAENIGVNFHYKPVYAHSYYQKRFKIQKTDFPIVEKVTSQLISLPLFPKMTRKDGLDVVRAVKKVTTHYA